MKVDKQKLRSKMALHGDTNATLAEAINISPQRLSAKINETGGAEFTQGEIQGIKERYHLTNDEAADIFLN